MIQDLTVKKREPDPHRWEHPGSHYNLLAIYDFFPVIPGDSVACGVLVVQRRKSDGVVVGEIVISHKSAATYADQAFVDKFFPPVRAKIIELGAEVPTVLCGELWPESGQIDMIFTVPA